MTRTRKLVTLLAAALAVAVTGCTTAPPPVVELPGPTCSVWDHSTAPPTIREIPCPDADAP